MLTDKHEHFRAIEIELKADWLLYWVITNQQRRKAKCHRVDEVNIGVSNPGEAGALFSLLPLLHMAQFTVI